MITGRETYWLSCFTNLTSLEHLSSASASFFHIGSEFIYQKHSDLCFKQWWRKKKFSESTILLPTKSTNYLFEWNAKIYIKCKKPWRHEQNTDPWWTTIPTISFRTFFHFPTFFFFFFVYFKSKMQFMILINHLNVYFYWVLLFDLGASVVFNVVLLKLKNWNLSIRNDLIRHTK